MAEELDIRSLWRKGKEAENPQSLHLNMLEKKGTKTTLYWIRFILWIEFWLTIVGGPFAVVWMHHMFQSWTVSTLYALLCIAYLFYYRFLIRKINDFSYAGNVVASLRKVYGYLRFYLLHYKAIIWISLAIGFVLGLMEGLEKGGGIPEDAGLTEWVLIILISSVMIGIMGAILTLLIHLIYGRKIRRLRRMVKELEQEETET